MKIYAVAYVVTALVFLGIDFIWLSMTGNTLYRPILGDMMVEKVRMAPAIAFYLLYVTGLLVFAVAPAFRSARWGTAVVYGALFGFFAYATYDLTNQATLKTWSVVITLADIAWGTTLSAVASTLGYVVAARTGGVVRR